MRHIFFLSCMIALLFGLLLFPAKMGLAEDEKLPVPRFVTLDSREVNLRAGPGKEYPILWVYRRKGLPVEIVQEFDDWRRIRDREGTLGWVQQNLLSGRRNVQILPPTRALLAEPQEESRLVARLEPGVIAKVIECAAGLWCRIEADGVEGWMPRAALWGVREDEILEKN